MSLEARVTALENKQFELLGHAFHENNKILEATHGVVSLVLNEQRNHYRDYAQFKREVFAFIKQQNNRSDKIEELLIQIVNSLTSK